METPLQYWSSWASIAGLVLGVASCVAAMWAAIAATKAKDAAERARKEIRQKVFQYSVSAARSLLDRLDDTVTIRKDFSAAADHARTLADMMDEIANASVSPAKSIKAEANVRSDWNRLATELRDWRARFLELCVSRTKHLVNINEWCTFTSRAKTKMNAFLGPVTEMR